MKAKVYPLNSISNEVDTIYSSFGLHFEILCASLAKGTSVIKGVARNKELDTTIAWCRQFGASIRENEDSLIIKGVNRRMNLKNNLFSCDADIAPKLFSSIFCVVNTPVGIKTENVKCFEEMLGYKTVFDAFGVNFYTESNVLRFEHVLTGTEVEIDGDTDIYFVGGLMLALSIVKSDSIIRLRAPIRNEQNYKTILKILKKFHIDIKHPATMQYEIYGFQKPKKCHIRTENDGIQLCHLILLSQALQNDESYIKFLKYHQKSLSSDSSMYRDLRNVISKYQSFRHIARKKTISLKEMDLTVDDTLPYLMVLGTFNDKEFVINRLDLHKERNMNQFDIMCNAFRKLGLHFETDEERMTISPSQVYEKKQIDCCNDPYCAMALIYLALLSKAPIVILNVDCIYNVNSEIFDLLKEYGAQIEFIHN